MIVGDFISIDKKSKVGNICIERKDINDFVSSILDNRLFIQAIKMKELGFSIIIFLISGNYDDIHSKINVNAVYGALASLVTKYRCSVCYVPTESALVYTVLSIFKHCQYEISSSILVPKMNISKEQREIAMLSCVPGIGKDLSERILMKYSIREVILIDELKELMTIKGIGKGKANTIIGFFSGDKK